MNQQQRKYKYEYVGGAKRVEGQYGPYWQINVNGRVFRITKNDKKELDWHDDYRIQERFPADAQTGLSDAQIQAHAQNIRQNMANPSPTQQDAQNADLQRAAQQQGGAFTEDDVPF